MATQAGHGANDTHHVFAHKLAFPKGDLWSSAPMPRTSRPAHQLNYPSTCLWPLVRMPQSCGPRPVLPMTMLHAMSHPRLSKCPLPWLPVPMLPNKAASQMQSRGPWAHAACHARVASQVLPPGSRCSCCRLCSLHRWDFPQASSLSDPHAI